MLDFINAYYEYFIWKIKIQIKLSLFIESKHFELKFSHVIFHIFSAQSMYQMYNLNKKPSDVKNSYISPEKRKEMMRDMK